MPVEIEAAVPLLEARLLTVADVTYVDRLVMPRGNVKTRADKGVWLTLGPSANNFERRQRHETQVTDTVRVGLSVRINPHAQRASRTAALTLETAIRRALTHYPWYAAEGLEVTYEATIERGVDAEHYVIVQEFSVSRVGGLGAEL